jgi:hypothetical protein
MASAYPGRDDDDLGIAQRFARRGGDCRWIGGGDRGHFRRAAPRDPHLVARARELFGESGAHVSGAEDRDVHVLLLSFALREWHCISVTLRDKQGSARHTVPIIETIHEQDPGNEQFRGGCRRR